MQHIRAAVLVGVGGLDEEALLAAGFGGIDDDAVGVGSGSGGAQAEIDAVVPGDAVVGHVEDHVAAAVAIRAAAAVEVVFATEGGELRIADLPAHGRGADLGPRFAAIVADEVIEHVFVRAVIDVSDERAIGEMPESTVAAPVGDEGQLAALRESFAAIGADVQLIDVLFGIASPVFDGVVGEVQHADFAIAILHIIHTATRGTEGPWIAPVLAAVLTLADQRHPVGLPQRILGHIADEVEEHDLAFVGDDGLFGHGGAAHLLLVQLFGKREHLRLAPGLATVQGTFELHPADTGVAAVVAGTVRIKRDQLPRLKLHQRMAEMTAATFRGVINEDKAVIRRIRWREPRGALGGFSGQRGRRRRCRSGGGDRYQEAKMSEEHDESKRVEERDLIR